MRQRHTIPNYVNAYLSHPNETFKKKKKESKDELQERVKEEKSRKKNEPR